MGTEDVRENHGAPKARLVGECEPAKSTARAPLAADDGVDQARRAAREAGRDANPSNDPLIIDQPEDDFDNAFIFASVVSTLRYIKERRQVVIVTHNANIAGLGDSELLCPMKRSGNAGVTFERGSIDRRQTKTAAQDILEGGERAFLKRQALYGLT